MYKVTLSGSYEGQAFRFHNYDDAFNFASMAVESGTVEGFRYEKLDGETIKIAELPVPVAVTIVGEEE